ncbi:MAG: prohibitin family protein [Clostridiales bacterium]|jgi:regulator of protease activity HflC (stomatin/prohibitin superfamily)|nr:prohibitin family protein [Clostridiales bacterium]
MAVFLGFLFALLGLGAVGGAVAWYWKKKNGLSRDGRVKKPVILVLLGVAACMLFCFITIPFGIRTVDAGEIAVIKVFGEAKEAKTAGMHFVNVFTTKLDIYDARVQQLEIPTEVYTNDAQPATVQLIVQFKIDPLKAVDIAKNYDGMDKLKAAVANASVGEAKGVLASKTAMKLIESRNDLAPAIKTDIERIQGKYFITVESVIITDMAFSDAFEKAVEEKMIAEQKKLEAEYAREQAKIKAEEGAEVAEIKAEADLAVAKLNAERALAAAKGEADAQAAIAEGAARALKIQYVETARMLGLPIAEEPILDEQGQVVSYEYSIDTSAATQQQYLLLEQYMRYINYLDTWDGKLPQVIGDGDAIGGIIIQPNPPATP